MCKYAVSFRVLDCCATPVIVAIETGHAQTSVDVAESCAHLKDLDFTYQCQKMLSFLARPHAGGER